jgi:hypothetical protein
MNPGGVNRGRPAALILGAVELPHANAAALTMGATNERAGIGFPLCR